MNKTALIIGASGQDGSFLTSFLSKKKYNVICASRDADSNNFLNHKILKINGKVKYVTLNINEFSTILKVLEKFKPDEIYNLAAQSSVGLSFEKPIETVESIICGTLNILEAIKFSKIKTKFYNAGSSESFGNHDLDPINELTKRNPISPYGISKSSAYDFVDMYRKSYSMFCCTGILFNHESQLRGPKFVTKKIIETAVKIKKGIENTLTLGNIDIHRDWGWAPEYVEAMWLMLQQNSPEDFIIATGKTNSLENFVCHAFQCLNLDYKKYIRTEQKFFRPLDIKYNLADPAKAAKLIGWKAKSDMYSVVEKLIDIELEKYQN
jgi:GDPmannose 4,6-dehydratase